MKAWFTLFLATALLGAGWGVLAQDSAGVSHLLAAAVSFPERLLTRAVPRGETLEGLTREEREAARALAKRLQGRIVWSSNRAGNHELYLLDLQSVTLRRLTTHPHVDYFSRFSPDGRRLVFMRSQSPRVSFRNNASWDIYVMDADGGGEQLLARAGYAPFWTPDGSAVIFSRANRVVRVTVATGREDVVLDADEALPGFRVAGANFSPDGRRLALTVRGRFDGVAVYDLTMGRLTPVMRQQSCQIVWTPHGGSTVWIATGGTGGTRVMQSGPNGPRVLMDLPHRYSHEYFPALSQDGRWLVWGAAAEGHEHDRADYEIFVWEVGTPWEHATRLTHHSGNDQWPEIYVGSAR